MKYDSDVILYLSYTFALCYLPKFIAIELAVNDVVNSITIADKYNLSMSSTNPLETLYLCVQMNCFRLLSRSS